MNRAVEAAPVVLMNYVKTFKHDFKNKHAGEMAIKRAAEWLKAQGIIEIKKSCGLNNIILISNSKAAAYFFEERLKNTNLTIKKISIPKKNIKTKLANHENKILQYIFNKKYIEISQCKFLGRGYFVAQKINDIIDTMLNLWKKGLIKIIRVKDGFLTCPIKHRIAILFNQISNKSEWYTNDNYKNTITEQELIYYRFIQGP